MTDYKIDIDELLVDGNKITYGAKMELKPRMKCMVCEMVFGCDLKEIKNHNCIKRWGVRGITKK